MKNKTFCSYSFGCRVNEAEREEIDRQMILSGFDFDPDKPDIFIINSCAITQKAERETRQLIYQIKKKLPNTKIVVTGCALTYWLKNKLYQNIPIDLFIDNKNKALLVAKLHRFDGQTMGKIGVSNKFLNSGRALIKIQDGCQRFCSYCVVPYLRGAPKSFRIKEIIDKINFKIASSPAKRGPRNDKISEVILTAINTEAFGYDTGEKFVDLLKNVINKTSVSRISLGSIHPWSVNNDFFKFYREYLPKKRLVNFFHIPLQSGSDKILSLMKRGYTRDEFVKKLDALTKINPYAFIATDVIVGFLDETNRDFEETYEFLKQSPISKFHVFRFSSRKNTTAFYLSERLKEPSSQEKMKRAKILIKLSQEKYNKFLQKNLGRESTVLLLKRNENGLQEGLLDNQLPIYIDIKGRKPTCQVDISVGLIVSAKIIGYKSGKLFGKII